MKKLSVNNLDFHIESLTEQLFDAFPEWVYTNSLGERETRVNIAYSSNSVSVECPDDVDEGKFQAVISAHKSSDLSRGEVERQKYTLANSSLQNVNFAQLKTEIDGLPIAVRPVMKKMLRLIYFLAAAQDKTQVEDVGE